MSNPTTSKAESTIPKDQELPKLETPVSSKTDIGSEEIDHVTKLAESWVELFHQQYEHVVPPLVGLDYGDEVIQLLLRGMKDHAKIEQEQKNDAWTYQLKFTRTLKFVCQLFAKNHEVEPELLKDKILDIAKEKVYEDEINAIRNIITLTLEKKQDYHHYLLLPNIHTEEEKNRVYRTLRLFRVPATLSWPGKHMLLEAALRNYMDFKDASDKTKSELRDSTIYAPTLHKYLVEPFPGLNEGWDQLPALIDAVSPGKLGEDPLADYFIKMISVLIKNDDRSDEERKNASGNVGRMSNLQLKRHYFSFLGLQKKADIEDRLLKANQELAVFEGQRQGSMEIS